MPYKDKQKQLDYLAVYRKTHKEYHLKKWRDFVARNPGYTKKYHKKWIENNKEKTSAHMKVYYALKIGRLKKESCYCGSKAEAHHNNYSKPLEVVWLCRKHHKEHHKF